MKIQPFTVVLFITLFIFACTATENSIGDNSTERRYNNALSNLKSGSTSTKHVDNLKSILTEIVTTNEGIKDSLSRDLSLENKELTYDINDYLIQKIFPTTAFTGGLYASKMDSLQVEQQALQAELQTFFFTQGKQHLDKAINLKDKLEGQKAYFSFEKAQKYGASVDDLLQQSLQHSVISYNFKAIAAENRYQILVDERFVGVEDINRKFKKFYYRNDSVHTDCSITIAFDRFQDTQEEQRETKSFQQQVQTGTRTETDGNGNEKEVATFGTVYGTAIKIQKIKTFTCQITLSATSTSNSCDVTDKLILETLTVSATEINVSGDERALPEEYQNFSPQILPMDRDIVEQLIEQAYQRIQSELFI